MRGRQCLEEYTVKLEISLVMLVWYKNSVSFHLCFQWFTMSFMSAIIQQTCTIPLLSYVSSRNAGIQYTKILTMLEKTLKQTQNTQTTPKPPNKGILHILK